jgi:hypothetical protein
MASKVEIINSALRSLGADSISAPDEDSENARKMDSVYDIVLKSMLRAHPWSFAKKESALSRTSDAPVLDDFTYIFTLPPDFIKLTKTDVEPTYSHKIKGRALYSNSDAVSIEYIYFCEDTSQFDDAFVEAFAAKLAAELCFAITAKANLIEVKWAEFKQKFNQARSMNAMEITPDSAICDTWINSRS